MVSYYYVESESGGKNNKRYVISNARDRRTVSKTELVRAIKDGRVVLTNYALSSTGSMELVKLRTNQIVPQEKIFQSQVVNKLMNGFMMGKPIVNDHLNLVISIVHRERDAAINKFAKRLLEAVRMYISYLGDVDIKLIIRSECKAIKLYKYADRIVDNTNIRQIENISNNVGLATEFSRFKSKYKESFSSYDFLLVLLDKMVEHANYINEVEDLVKILMSILELSKYTFIGEQLDKQFCNDLMKQYSNSVLNNSALDLHRLTSAERQAKADESCKFIKTGYDNFTNKLNADRGSIISSIRGGGQQAADILDELNKLDSFDYTKRSLMGGRVKAEEYEEFLLGKYEETKLIIAKIQESFKYRGFTKAVTALSTATDLGSSAMLKSINPVNIGTGAILKCANACVETEKLAGELSEYCVNTNLPPDVAKIINKIGNGDIFVINLILYQYDKLIYLKVKNDAFKKGARTVTEIYFNIEDKFKKLRNKKYKNVDTYMLSNYEQSYIGALSDLTTIDSKRMLDKLYHVALKSDLMTSDRLKTDLIHLEKAWIPAYRILCSYVESSNLINFQMEQIVFWKIFEDMYTALKMERIDEFRGEHMDNYIKAFNEVYGTKFIRSKDININILKILKDTRN